MGGGQILPLPAIHILARLIENVKRETGQDVPVGDVNEVAACFGKGIECSPAFLLGSTASHSSSKVVVRKTSSETRTPLLASSL
jgi:hypothetical protein